MNQTHFVGELVQTASQILIEISRTPVLEIKPFQRGADFKPENRVDNGNVNAFAGACAERCQRLRASF